MPIKTPTLDPNRDRFNRLAPARVDTIRDTLRKLSNCSNPNNYAWNPEVAQKLFALLFWEFMCCAQCFGFTVEATIDGTNVTDFISDP